ncbi:unnamed protein product [Mycena citricolor]|uniref:Ribosome maturation protein SDO1 n=1 Tax=Mycena citricolor TaxID=2018698 RepID=A0AAD2K5G6_9AGAR|nr:unnamed protein product [Mycena citricolor]
MPQIYQPSNQIKLTNVSIVRLKKGGKRFEIACYKNKVQEWRTGVETNLDDVLQISNVFTNVSKGEVAKTNDLDKAFGKIGVDEVVKEILKKGEMQVGEKERDHDLSALRKEIATLVAEKCQDPATGRPYAVGIIEKAMSEAGYSVSACLKQLQSDSSLPIQRVRMRIRVTMPSADGKRLREKVLADAETVEVDEMEQDGWEAILHIDPGQFRVINELLQKECKGKGRIETMPSAAT